MSFDQPLFHRHGLRLSRFRVGAGERVQGHRHGNTHVLFLLNGEARQRRGRDSVDLGPFSARYSGADAVHDMEFGPGGGDCLVVHFRHAHRGASGSSFLPSSVAQRHVQSVAALLQAPDTAPLALLEVLYAGVQLPRADQIAPDWLDHARVRLLGPAPVRTARVARDLGVSREHLSRAFTAHYGVAPQLTRRCARLAYAAGLLVRSRSESTEIAHIAGYSDQSHFIRDFRWAFGVTPQQFRRTRVAADHKNSIARH
jgi:AraC family transcriptional regulator